MNNDLTCLRSSFEQNNLYFDFKAQDNQTVQNLVFIYRAEKGLDFDLLQYSWEILHKEFSCLSCSYHEIDGVPYVCYDNSGNVSLYVCREKASLKLEEWIQKLQFHELNISKVPLWRIEVFTEKNGRQFIGFLFHHLIIDGITLNHLFKRFEQIYKALSERKVIKFPPIFHDKQLFVDYLKHQNEKTVTFEKENKNYFSHLVKNGVNFAFPKKIDSQKGYSKRLYLNFDQKKKQQLKDLSEGLNTTPFLCLLSVFVLFLSRFYQNPEIKLGYPIGKREENFKNLYGFFVNIFPIIIDVDYDWTFEKLSQEIANLHKENVKRKHFDFFNLKKLVRAHVSDKSMESFNVFFASTFLGFEKLNLGNKSLKNIKIDRTLSLYDLVYYIDFNNMFPTLTIEYREESFEKYEIENHLKVFDLFLDQTFKNPQKTLRNFNFQTTDTNTIEDNNQLKSISSLRLFSDLFVDVVKKYPDYFAIQTQTDKFTYQELNSFSDAFAYNLLQKGIKKGEVVVIALEKSYASTACIVACLKIGAVFLSLDTSLPKNRRDEILKDCQPKVIITANKFKTLFNRNSLLFSEEIPKKINKILPQIRISANDPAYIIYTSGSSGKPKGVVNHQGGFANIASFYVNYLDIKPKATVLYFGSLNFDVSLLEFAIPLISGGCLVLPFYKQAELVIKLPQVCNENKVDVIFLSPSVLNTLDPEKFSTLRSVISIGEAIIPSLIEKWHNRVDLYNGYGPSETSICATIHPVKFGEPTTLIGKAIDGLKIHIMDQFNRILPNGGIGQIVISGLGVGIGYLNDQEKADKVFFKDKNLDCNFKSYATGDYGYMDSEKRVHYLGRKDEQIKINGFRIELGEIENVALKREEIESAIAILTPQKKIYLFIKVKNQRDNFSSLFSFIKEYVPYYMAPSKIFIIEKIPYTRAGKVDRKILLTDQYFQQNEVEYEKSVQVKQIPSDILKIWNGILTESKNNNDSFFRAGGDSLLATKLVLEIEKKLNIKIKISDFFANPTLDFITECYEKRHQNLSAIKEKLNFKKIWLESDINDLNFSAAHFILDEINVFLTGSTGFLGAYLLRKLQSNGKVKKVYCLVRASNDLEAKHRLQDNFYQYINDCRIDWGKIKIVRGDLSSKKLGLSSAIYETLSNEISHIIHSGAKVHHLDDFSNMYAANVGGTEEIIKMAAIGSKKHIHYISSISAINDLSGKQTFSESLPVDYECTRVYGGYSQSKWVSEHLVRLAIERNASATIYRLPTLWPGNNGNDFFNYQKDHQTLFLQGCAKMGLFPNLDKRVLSLPVDYIAQLLNQIFLNPFTDGRVFNLLPDKQIKFNEIIGFLQYKNISCKTVTIEEWIKELKKISQSNPLYSLIPFYTEQPIEDLNKAKFLFDENSSMNMNEIISSLKIEKPNQNYYVKILSKIFMQ